MKINRLSVNNYYNDNYNNDLVINCTRNNINELPKLGLGNPFLESEWGLKECIEKFENFEYFKKKYLKLKSIIDSKNVDNVYLLCFCDEKQPCHCDKYLARLDKDGYCIGDKI